MAYIDRDPEQMMRYGSDARQIIDEMYLVIRKTESLLDAYAADLDDPTRRQIQELHTCCSDCFKHLDKFREVADSINRKGKKLYEVRNGG